MPRPSRISASGRPEYANRAYIRSSPGWGRPKCSRVQNDTLRHRGRKNDPLYRARRRLTMARERLTGEQHDRLMGLLRAALTGRKHATIRWEA